MKYNKCKNCLIACPENCRTCVFQYCKKEVDYALTYTKWEHMVSFIGTDKENEEEHKFYIWFKQYFGLNNSYRKE